MVKTNTIEVFDKVGSAASIACAIHCLAMPFVITVMPLVGLSFFASEQAEWMLFAASALIATFNLCWGYRKHKSRKALTMAVIGLTLLTIGRLLDHHSQHHGGFDWYVLFLVAGGFWVAASHWINRKLCSACHKCHH